MASLPAVAAVAAACCCCCCSCCRAVAEAASGTSLLLPVRLLPCLGGSPMRVTPGTEALPLLPPLPYHEPDAPAVCSCSALPGGSCGLMGAAYVAAAGVAVAAAAVAVARARLRGEPSSLPALLVLDAVRLRGPLEAVRAAVAAGVLGGPLCSVCSGTSAGVFMLVRT